MEVVFKIVSLEWEVLVKDTRISLRDQDKELWDLLEVVLKEISLTAKLLSLKP